MKKNRLQRRKKAAIDKKPSKANSNPLHLSGQPPKSTVLRSGRGRANVK
jgi:hypothetical protein